jgi:GT2 family glycosyltransferase
VVDDGSQDDTAKVCDIMRSELPNLKYIFTGTNVGIARARNIGIEGSSGKYILFTDDDCIPAKDWLERLSAVLQREPIAAGAIAIPFSNYFKLCHNIAQFHAFLPGRKARFTEFLAGANMAFRRSVLEELNGFQPHLRVSQDIELILRARSRGYRAFFEPEALVIHDPDRTTLASIFKYAAEHATTTIVLRNQYRSLLRTPFVLRSPTLILAASPLIALKVTSGIYLKNPSLVKYFWTAPVVYALKLGWCWGAARSLRNWYNAGEEHDRGDKI